MNTIVPIVEARDNLSNSQRPSETLRTHLLIFMSSIDKASGPGVGWINVGLRWLLGRQSQLVQRLCTRVHARNVSFPRATLALEPNLPSDIHTRLFWPTGFISLQPV